MCNKNINFLLERMKVRKPARSLSHPDRDEWMGFVARRSLNVRIDGVDLFWVGFRLRNRIGGGVDV
jgi:hypothetical protein